MKRCKYAILLIEQRWGEQSELHRPRCERRNVLGSSGWHEHRARLPRKLAIAHHTVRICWRSTNTPDYVHEEML